MNVVKVALIWSKEAYLVTQVILLFAFFPFQFIFNVFHFIITYKMFKSRLDDTNCGKIPFM